MAPSRVVAGKRNQSSLSSGIVSQKNGQPEGGINSHLGQLLGKSANSIAGSEYANLDQGSGVTNILLNGLANSGSSVGTSSLVTDENSPVSLSPNNVSCSSGIDGPSVMQRASQQDQSSQMPQELQTRVALNATSLATPQRGQALFHTNMSSSSIAEHYQLSQPLKKQRFDIKQENIMHQPFMQQTMGQNSFHMPGLNPQSQLLLQEQRQCEHNQQIRQSMSHMQRAQFQQQHQEHPQQLQQQQLRNRIPQQQGVQQPLSIPQPPSSEGVCSRRIMQYLYHQQQRPAVNTIAYWRKFVEAYYSPRGKKKWCLSLYRNVGQHAFGVFSQAAMDAWQCNLCGSKSGKGFESSFEILPRLNEIKYGCGVIDELLYLELPNESRLDSGLMKLEYGRAVQETVYDKTRVVREGQLRIIFDRDLKILSWEFCARRHEEYLPMRLVAPKVKEMVNAALKCQSAIAESGSEGVSRETLETNSNTFVAAGRELSRTLDTQSLNEMGFSKRYVRSLQISEVVNSMKDLIDFSVRHKAGPIESLKSYPRHVSAAKLQMQKMQEAEQFAIFHGLPTDRNTLNKLMMVMNPLNVGSSSGSPQVTALAQSSYQNMLRQNSINSNIGSLQREALLPSFNNSSPGPSSTFQNTPFRGFSKAHLPQEQQRPMLNVANLLQQNQSQQSQGNQALQQYLNQMNNNGSMGQNANRNVGRDSGSYRNILGGSVDSAPNRSNSVISATTIDYPRAESDQNAQNPYLTEDNMGDDEFTRSLLNNEFDDNMNY